MTNKIVLRSIEEFMNDYRARYTPLYSMFLGNSQEYSEEVGKIDFRRATTVGDIRMARITPKDTEIKQISVNDGTKTFKKYFRARQYIVSDLQDRDGIESVQAEVLDENQKLADDLLLLGDGAVADGAGKQNNGLFWSDDPNYTSETSTEIDTDADPLLGLHSAVMTNAEKADAVSGRKALVFYGTNIIPKVNGIFTASGQSFRQVLQSSLGTEFTIAKMPAAVTPSGANGWMIVNLDNVKLHYVTLPKIRSQGVNEEKMYAWTNFLMGSMMLDVLAKDAVIKQPATLEA